MPKAKRAGLLPDLLIDLFSIPVVKAPRRTRFNRLEQRAAASSYILERSYPGYELSSNVHEVGISRLLATLYDVEVDIEAIEDDLRCQALDREL